MRMNRAFCNWVRNDTIGCANMALVKELVYPFCFNHGISQRFAPKMKDRLQYWKIVGGFSIAAKMGEILRFHAISNKR